MFYLYVYKYAFEWTIFSNDCGLIVSQ